VKELSVIVENKPGVLAQVANILGKSGINIDAINAETFGDGAVIRLNTRDNNTARELLEKAKHRVAENDVLAVRMEDKPGELHKVASKLANANVNIERFYMISKNTGSQTYAFKVNDLKRAEKALGKQYLA